MAEDLGLPPGRIYSLEQQIARREKKEKGEENVQDVPRDVDWHVVGADPRRLRYAYPRTNARAANRCADRGSGN